MPLSRNPEMRKHQLANLTYRGKKGEHFSPATEFKKGYVPWNKGLRGYHMHFSEDEKRKRAERIKKHRHLFTKDERSKIQKRLWSNSEHHKRMSEVHKKPRLCARRRVSLTCQQCGKSFEVLLYRKNSAKFCSRACIALSKVGIPPWNKGIPMSEESRRKLSKSVEKLWRNLEYRNKTSIARIAAQRRRPTKPERELMRIINENNLPFRYVGDGSLILYGLNPDFVDCDGSKRIIEVFGDYWHSGKRDLRWQETEQGKKAVYGQLGFKALVIWEHELKEPDKVLEKIKEFDRS